MTEISGQYYPTKEQIKANILATMVAQGARVGRSYNTAEGSEYEALFAEPIAIELSAVMANNKIANRSRDPRTASDEDVVANAAVAGVVARPAEKAKGPARIDVITGTVTIPDGKECTGPNGKTYVAATQYTSVADDAVITLVAKEGGTESNLSEGAILTWDDPSIGNLRRQLVVGAGGISDGKDADGVEQVRQRYINNFANPKAAGNWADIKETAEGASSAVAAAYVYQAPQGGNSYGLALVSSEDDGELDDVTVADVAAAVVAKHPGFVNLNATSVTSQGIDVAFTTKAPLPRAAGGDGSGWIDGSPWPTVPIGVPIITGYSSGEITTSATSLGTLVPGNRIAIWQASEKRFYHYVVSAASIGGGFVKIQVVGGFSQNGHVGSFVSPDAKNIDGWGAFIVAECKKLGPGEKVTSPFLLPRALRQPHPSQSGEMDMNSRLCSELQKSYTEISDIRYAARYATGTTTPLTGPSVPASSLDPPNRLTLVTIGFVANLT